jgi:hypothetical protein
MQRCTGGVYYSGLWYSDFAQGLLWYNTTRKTLGFRDLEVASTWSWASISGPISYQMRSQVGILSSFAVVMAGSIPSRLDLLGAGKGVVVITGSLVPVGIRFSRVRGNAIDVVMKGIEWEWNLNMERTYQVTKNGILVYNPPHMGGTEPGGVIIPDTQEDRALILEGRRLFCLLIATVRYDNKYDYSYWDWHKGIQLKDLWFSARAPALHMKGAAISQHRGKKNNGKRLEECQAELDLIFKRV